MPPFAKNPNLRISEKSKHRRMMRRRRQRDGIEEGDLYGTFGPRGIDRRGGKYRGTAGLTQKIGQIGPGAERQKKKKPEIRP